MLKLDMLKKAIREHLPDLDLVIGWRQGYDPLRTTPYYIREEADLEHLTWSPLCVNNLASLLMHLRGRKVGLCVKGCDSRSVVQLLQEGIINRESVVIFGLPCRGVVDLKKIRKSIDIDHGTDVCLDKDTIHVAGHGDATSIPLADVLADKCIRCQYPNPLEYDELIGNPLRPRVEEAPDDLFPELMVMSLEERFEFWTRQMDRCIRCYACRHACPLCFCRDYCIADSRDPKWMSQETDVREKWTFQMIHAMHLAGRCTECGECERACPMDIPVLLFKRHLNSEIKQLFNYEAGVDPDATPPLLTFQVEEDAIEEGDLS